MSLAQLVTPDLQRWIVDQAKAGAQPDAVLASMRASGWDTDVAEQALEDTLRGYLAGEKYELPPADAAALEATGRSPLRFSSGAVSTSQQPLGHALRVPEPLRSDGSLAHSLLACDAARIKVSMQLMQPRVVVFSGLLAEAECDGLVALARARLARSETVEVRTGAGEINASRTSEGMFFDRQENALCTRVEQRIARLCDWPLDHGEGLQILRYQPGAEYKPHYDYFDPAQRGTAAVLARGGQRVASLVMYLNTPERGGATVFPDVELSIAPIKGSAVFFSYDRPHPSTRTLHGGAPLIDGEKWVATKWLRERCFA